VRGIAAAVCGLSLLATACGAGSEAAGQTTLTVYAAASLAESFGALEKRFEAEHPGVDVTLNLGASSRLAQQIDEGAQADVFASADERNMEKIAASGRAAGQPTVFATNTLTTAVAPGNPKGIERFADLARPGLTVVTCAAQVPCGSAAERVERSTGVTLTPASEEQDVKSVLTKVLVGEADAGLVYATDAMSAAGKVDRVDFPESADAVNRYPITVVEGSPQAELAHEFTRFVLGVPGAEELGRAGFGPP